MRLHADRLRQTLPAELSELLSSWPEPLEIPNLGELPQDDRNQWWVRQLQDHSPLISELWLHGVIPVLSLRGLHLTDCQINAWNLNLAQVSACTFERVHFEDVSFDQSSFYATVFTDCTFQGTSCQRATWFDVELRGCRFLGTDFESTLWENLTAERCSWEGVRWEDCVLAHSQLVDQTWDTGWIAGGRWTDTHLQNCRFLGCTIQDLRQQRVILEETSGLP